LIVIQRFSLVKAAMNDPCICKLRNGVKKTPSFHYFQIAKGGTKTIAHFSIVEGFSFRSLDRRIYDCKKKKIPLWCKECPGWPGIARTAAGHPPLG
jgi:hypothetical protein